MYLNFLKWVSYQPPGIAASEQTPVNTDPKIPYRHISRSEVIPWGIFGVEQLRLITVMVFYAAVRDPQFT